MRDAATSRTDEGEPRLPRRFGRYALFDYIGKGGMAEIFLARATTELGAARLCVVKQIIPAYAKHPQFAEMLIHEAKLAARLNHAHIVQVFDLGRSDDELFIAMEYVEGYDLNALLRRCSQSRVPLPFEYALGVVCDVLQALDYAHRRTDDAGKPLGIVHRDVSPSNILISLEGEVKLCDFGIAHANDLVQQVGEQVDEAIKGKAGYMSPEHARGEAIDARADVFAIGIVLWELIAGRRMYRKEPGAPSLLEQARRAEVPPLPLKSLPHEPKLHAIVDRALSVSRDARYPSANAMLRALSAYMSEAKLVASVLKLGEWLVDRFGDDFNEQRRRERMSPAPPSVRKSEPPRSRPSLPSSPSSPPPAEPSRPSAAPGAIDGGAADVSGPASPVTPSRSSSASSAPSSSLPAVAPEDTSGAPPSVPAPGPGPESRASVSPIAKAPSAPPRPGSAVRRADAPTPGDLVPSSPLSSASSLEGGATIGSPRGASSASPAAPTPVPPASASGPAVGTVPEPPPSLAAATVDVPPSSALPIIALPRPKPPGIPPWVLLLVAAIVVVLGLLLVSRMG